MNTLQLNITTISERGRAGRERERQGERERERERQGERVRSL